MTVLWWNVSIAMWFFFGQAWVSEQWNIIRINGHWLGQSCYNQLRCNCVVLFSGQVHDPRRKWLLCEPFRLTGHHGCQSLCHPLLQTAWSQRLCEKYGHKCCPWQVQRHTLRIFFFFFKKVGVLLSFATPTLLFFTYFCYSLVSGDDWQSHIKSHPLWIRLQDHIHTSTTYTFTHCL